MDTFTLRELKGSNPCFKLSLWKEEGSFTDVEFLLNNTNRSWGWGKAEAIEGSENRVEYLITPIEVHGLKGEDLGLAIGDFLAAPTERVTGESFSLDTDGKWGEVGVDEFRGYVCTYNEESDAFAVGKVISMLNEGDSQAAYGGLVGLKDKIVVKKFDDIAAACLRHNSNEKAINYLLTFYHEEIAKKSEIDKQSFFQRCIRTAVYEKTHEPLKTLLTYAKGKGIEINENWTFELTKTIFNTKDKEDNRGIIKLLYENGASLLSQVDNDARNISALAFLGISSFHSVDAETKGVLEIIIEEGLEKDGALNLQSEIEDMEKEMKDTSEAFILMKRLILANAETEIFKETVDACQRNVSPKASRARI